MRARLLGVAAPVGVGSVGITDWVSVDVVDGAALAGVGAVVTCAVGGGGDFLACGGATAAVVIGIAGRGVALEGLMVFSLLLGSSGHGRGGGS